MEVKQLLQFLLVILLFSLGGCTTYEVMETATSTPMTNKLKNYRPPERKVEIAVYQFNDQTGQRKPSDNLASLSTAVTQGSGTLLVQALKTAGNGDLISGGIIGYDTNIETGGVGSRYLGIGIRDQYRRDMVSVSLRLISVQTGEVLLAVSSQKTILSTKVGMNVFKFLDMGTELIEIEAGTTENESTTYAVRKAIEHAVNQLIERGIENALWKLK